MTQRKRGKMMKRIIYVILVALTIAVVIAGCITNNNNQAGNTTTTGTTTTTKPDGTTTTQAPVTTEKTDEPIEKPTASEAMAAYLKNLLRKNSGKNLTEIMGRLDEHPCFDSIETNIRVEPYPEDRSPYIYGFEYGTEFPEYVKSGSLFCLSGDVPFAATVFELKEGADREAFLAFLEEKSALDFGGEKPATMKAIGSEGNYAFIILCTEDLKTDINPDTEQTLVGIMKKVRTGAELSMGVTRMDVTSERAPYYFGIEENVDLLEKEGVICEPMIGWGFSLVMVEVKDEKDAQKVAKEMESGLNPRKWICVSAGYVSVKTCGKYVLGVMSSQEQCENITSIFESIFR